MWLEPYSQLTINLKNNLEQKEYWILFKKTSQNKHIYLHFIIIIMFYEFSPLILLRNIILYYFIKLIYLERYLKTQWKNI